MKIRREYSIAMLVLGAVGLLIFGINYLKGLDLFQKRNIYHVVYRDISGVTGASPVSTVRISFPAPCNWCLGKVGILHKQVTR